MDKNENEKKTKGGGGKEDGRSYKVLSVGMVHVFGIVPPKRGFSLMSLKEKEKEN